MSGDILIVTTKGRGTQYQDVVGRNQGCWQHLKMLGSVPTSDDYPASNVNSSDYTLILYYWCGKEEVQFGSVQSLSCVRLFVTLWTTAHQASLSITNSQSPPKLMCIESVMPSNHLILCCPLLLLPSIFPSITVFSNELALCMRWPKYWSFSFSISPSNEYPGLISFRMNWLDLLAVQGTLNTTVQKHQFFGIQLSLSSNSHIHTWYWKNHSLD